MGPGGDLVAAEMTRNAEHKVGDHLHRKVKLSLGDNTGLLCQLEGRVELPGAHEKVMETTQQAQRLARVFQLPGAIHSPLPGSPTILAISPSVHQRLRKTGLDLQLMPGTAGVSIDAIEALLPWNFKTVADGRLNGQKPLAGLT